MGTISVAPPPGADDLAPWCLRFNGQVICPPVYIRWDWELGCPQCGLAVDWLPDPGQIVGRQIALGISDLGNASLAADPAQRAQLRARALDAFTQAAIAAGSRPFVGTVGFMDESGAINAGPGWSRSSPGSPCCRTSTGPPQWPPRGQRSARRRH
jgi:hypothetical protein